MKKLLEKYSDNSWFRSLVNLIPYIGSSLDIILYENGTKWREKRIKILLDSLQEKLTKVEYIFDENTIEKLSESEEFYDIIIQSFNSVIKTRHKEKISCYANVLTNKISKPNDNKIESELILAVLESISLSEIKYLSYIFNKGDEIKTYRVHGQFIYWDLCLDYIKSTRKVPSNKEELPQKCLLDFDNKLIWKLLSDKNIIDINIWDDFETLKYSTGNSSFMISGEIVSSGRVEYKLTEFGKLFAEWIMSI